jgi:hypothetical protein
VLSNEPWCLKHLDRIAHLATILFPKVGVAADVYMVDAMVHDATSHGVALLTERPEVLEALLEFLSSRLMKDGQENAGNEEASDGHEGSGDIVEHGAPVGRELGRFSMRGALPYDEAGSCMIVVATDAPLGHRNLLRLAKRAMLGLGRTGGYASNGSGDYVIAFSTARPTLETIDGKPLQVQKQVPNSAMSPLFLAVVEATEEAIINSLFMATSVTGRDGHTAEALPPDKTLEILQKYKALNQNQTLPSWVH